MCWDLENVTFRISINEVLEGTTKAPDPQHSLSAQRVDGTSVNDTPETILEEYQEFMDVFSGEKANILAPH